MEKNTTIQKSCSSAISTPLADALINLTRKANVSFHALPISCGSSIESSELRGKYTELFGEAMLGTEMTVTGKHFDSFFFADSAINEAERLAAQLYGADGTLFVTSGTTVANQIALHALVDKNFHVLLDKSSHQSMHFTLQALCARVDYIIAVNNCEDSGRNHWSIDELLQQTLGAQEAGDPHDVIVLNAQSYDGVVYNIPGIIGHLITRGV
jgi:arginine/lysine/ornithine decarboxylase